MEHTEHINTHGLAPLERGILAKSGGAYAIFLLNPTHAAAVKRHHDRVRDAIPENRRDSLKPKTEQFFVNHPVIAAVAGDGQILGKCAINGTEPGSEPGTFWIQSVSVSPEYSGQGLMGKILDHAVRYIRIKGQTAKATVWALNKSSVAAFLKYGFTCAAEVIEGGTAKKILILDLTAKFNGEAAGMLPVMTVPAPETEGRSLQL